MISTDKLKRIKLFVGPMSKEIVDLVTEYSSESCPMGLIPSRRQIEFTKGYVNDWSTDDFSSYVKEKNHNVLLVRDHGGPDQGSKKDDGLESLEHDITSGFDILHIDPWKSVNSLDEGIQKTVDLIRFCCLKSESINFEVGTEEAIYPYSPLDLDKILNTLQDELRDDFKRIKYGVVQSGVRISGTSNIGNFNPERLHEMTEICRKHNVISKEHNGDYLTKKEILARVAQGLDCINIAPEFGVMQTLKILSKLNKSQFENAYDVCEKSKKYVKWLPEDQKDNPDKDTVIKVSGHYVFTKEPFSSLIPAITHDFKKSLFERFDEIIKCWD